VRLLAQDNQEPGDIPLLGDLPFRLDPDEPTQFSVAAKLGQAGFEVGMPQERRQKDDSPQGVHGIIVTAAAAPALQPFEELGVRHGGQELPDGLQAGAVFQTIPREQWLGEVDSHVGPP
jgi:hypothetical protein